MPRFRKKQRINEGDFMKKIILLSVVSIAFVGCATLSPAGSKVHIELVSKDVIAVDAAKKKLEAAGCKYVSNIEAPIAAGSSPIYGRLEIGLKNKTAEVGGNAVISSMESNMGMPIYTKGIVYKCEKSLVADGV